MSSACSPLLLDRRRLPPLAEVDAEIERRRLRACAPGLLDFTVRMFEARYLAPFKLAPHHALIADALEAVTRGETKRLIINMPPRASKTELAVVNFIAWCMGKWPDAEFIHASYGDDLATSNAQKIREVMQHDEYRRIFGAPQFRRDVNKKDEFRTTAGGCVYATGAAGAIVGYGAGKMRDGFGGAQVIDDPHKTTEAHSRTMRKNVIDWFTGTMESRRNSPHTPIIIVMQRVHHDDLCGFLLRGGNGEQWDHLCIPAMDEEGRSFWPVQFPAEDMRRIEASSSFVYQAQYQQKPKILGGNIIKSESFPLYTVSPKIKWRAIYADTAQETKKANDWTVFECWGLGEDGKAYLLDLLRGKWEAPELERRAIAFWTKHALAEKDGETEEEAAERVAALELLGKLRALKVEKAASGTGLIQSVKRQAKAPIVGIHRTKDKLTRVMDAHPYIESGYVCLPEGAPWLSDFLAECEEFTADDTHDHDDQIDPMCDAITDMLAKVGGGLWVR